MAVTIYEGVAYPRRNGIAAPLSGLVNAATKSLLRQPVGNGNLAPYTTSTSTNRARTYVKMRYVAKDATRTKIRLKYSNFTASGVSESIAYRDLVVKAGIALTYGGSITNATFDNGATEKYIPAGNTVETDDINITLTKNTKFYEIVKVILPLQYNTRTSPFVVGMVVTGGTSGATGTVLKVVEGTTGRLVLGSETGTFTNGETLTGVLAGYPDGVAVADLTTAQTYIYTVSSHRWNFEGVLSSQAASGAPSFVTNPPTLTATVSGGNITSVSGSGGSGYTSGPSLCAFEYVNNVLYSKNIGYSTRSGDALATNVVTSGTPPSGLAAWTNPSVVPVGGGGFGQDSALYCASEVSGIPDVAVNSIAVIGDSIARGDSSTDSTGDLYANHGIERMINNEIAVINMSRASARAGYDVQYDTIYPRLYGLYMGRATHCLIQLGTNDIAAGKTYNQLSSDINDIKTYVQSFKTEVSVSTIIPRVTGTYATEAGQTPVSGFASGETMDTYNTSVITGTIESDFGAYNPYGFYRGVDPNKFRVDLGAITGGGIHPNLLGHGVGGADGTLRSFFSKLG